MHINESVLNWTCAPPQPLTPLLTMQGSGERCWAFGRQAEGKNIAYCTLRSYTCHLKQLTKAIDSADPVEEQSSIRIGKCKLNVQYVYASAMNQCMKSYQCHENNSLFIRFLSRCKKKQDLRAVIRRLPGGRVALFAGGLRLRTRVPVGSCFSRCLIRQATQKNITRDIASRCVVASDWEGCTRPTPLEVATLQPPI